MTHEKIAVLVLAMTVGACDFVPEDGNKASQEVPAEVRAGIPSAGAPGYADQSDEVANADDFSQFIVAGETLLASQTGDLNGDGMQDAILVLDRNAQHDDGKLGQGAPRSLLVLLRHDAGRLRKASRNDGIVPCAKCGGIAGDPFGYVRIDDGAFTVLIEGGSRERWSNEYTFQYAADRQEWLLMKVISRVVDTASGQDNDMVLTESEFGVIEFGDFDPATVPSATIP